MSSATFQVSAQGQVHPVIADTLKHFGINAANDGTKASQHKETTMGDAKSAFPNDPIATQASALYQVVKGFVSSSCTRLRYEPEVHETAPGEFRIEYRIGADIARLHQLGLALNTLDGVVSVTQVVTGRSGFTSTTICQAKHY
jgi:hypothetical protein